MTPRVRRFLVLLLVVAGLVACGVWIPATIVKPALWILLGGAFVWALWELAALPFPWRVPWPWRRRE